MCCAPTLIETYSQFGAHFGCSGGVSIELYCSHEPAAPDVFDGPRMPCAHVLQPAYELLTALRSICN